MKVACRRWAQRRMLELRVKGQVSALQSPILEMSLTTPNRRFRMLPRATTQPVVPISAARVVTVSRLPTFSLDSIKVSFCAPSPPVE